MTLGIRKLYPSGEPHLQFHGAFGQHACLTGGMYGERCAVRGVTRRMRPSSFRSRRMVRGQAGSGLSVRAWCRRHGQRESAFYGWRSKLAGRDADQPATFVSVHVAEDAEASANAEIEIVLAGDRRGRVRGPGDRKVLADVGAVLMAAEGVASGPAC